jgi:hypothetical protein
VRRPTAIILLAAWLGLAGQASAASPDTMAARRAASWLEDQQISTAGQQADAIVALAAAGRSQSALQTRMSDLTALAPSYATTAGGAGKVVLAAVAAGTNPRSLGGVNYVDRIRSRYRSGRYGSTAYDQAYAILGLRAAGESVPGGAIRALRRARGSGGWSFSVRGGKDDVSATGVLMEAVRAAGVATTDPLLRSTSTWIAQQANAQGGFSIDGGRRPTEANSTAIAIRAWRAAGRKPPSRWRVALRSLQEPDGGIRFTAAIRESRVLATLDAVVAMSGRRLPPPY